MTHKCLVLDQSYMPRSVISSERAFVINYKGNAEIIKHYDTAFKLVNPDLKIFKPAVIRVDSYIHMDYQAVPLTRENILKRDNYCCVYCGENIKKAMTIDHVVPKSKGGEDTWENLVAACMPCNFEKDDLSLEEYGKEIPQPKRPHYIMLMKSVTHIPEEWKKYLFF